MYKLVMTSLAALAALLGSSLAASASRDDAREHAYRTGYHSERHEYCRRGDKRCDYRNRRRYDRREHGSRDRDDRDWRYDD